MGLRLDLISLESYFSRRWRYGLFGPLLGFFFIPQKLGFEVLVAWVSKKSTVDAESAKVLSELPAQMSLCELVVLLRIELCRVFIALESVAKATLLLQQLTVQKHQMRFLIGCVEVPLGWDE